MTVYDGQTDADGTIDAMNAAISDGSTYIVNYGGREASVAASIPIAKENTVPMISIVTSTQLQAIPDDGYFFASSISFNMIGQVNADLANEAYYPNATLIYLNDTYFQNRIDVFTAGFDGQIVDSNIINYNTINASTQVSEIIDTNPSVLIVDLFNIDLSPLVDRLHNQSVNIPILGGSEFFGIDVFDNSYSEAFLNNIVITEFYRPNTSEQIAFLDEYSTKGYSGGPFREEMYDSVMIGTIATIEADSVIGGDIIAKLIDLDHAGASGRILFDANGDRTTGYFKIHQAQASSFLQVGDWVNYELTYLDNFAMPGAFSKPVSSQGGTTTPALIVTNDVIADDPAFLPFPKFAFLVAFIGISFIKSKRKTIN